MAQVSIWLREGARDIRLASTGTKSPEYAVSWWTKEDAYVSIHGPLNHLYELGEAIARQAQKQMAESPPPDAPTEAELRALDHPDECCMAGTGCCDNDHMTRSEAEAKEMQEQTSEYRRMTK